MVNRTLPADWERTTVGEAGKTITGTTPPKSDVKNYGDFIPFIKPPELNDGSLWNSDDGLSEEGAQLARVVPEKAVLVSCIGNLGKTGIAKRPIAFNQQINAIVFPENVLPEFGFYYFQSTEFRKQLEDVASATTISIVNKSKFNSLSFPLAPLSEQERIVSRIEELFSDLEAGVAALERVQIGLQRYKVSVLKAAVEGRLFGNVEMGDDGLFPGWMRVTIDDVTESLDNKRIPVNKKERGRRQGKYPYYGANGQVDWIDDYIFDEPLVLVVEDETFTGREKPFSYKITGKTWVNNHAHVLRAKENILDIDYLNYSLAYYPFTPMTTGTTGRKKLTKSVLMAVPYLLPPLDEQRRIVAEVERRLSVVGEVESAVEAGLVRAGRLRQSVLRSAFEGR